MAAAEPTPEDAVAAGAEGQNEGEIEVAALRNVGGRLGIVGNFGGQNGHLEVEVEVEVEGVIEEGS